MQQMRRYVWLIAGFLSVLGCATLPEPPKPSGPYAVLEFPASMRLLSIDEQPVDARTRIDTARVGPGQHVLRFVHVNAGADGSSEHAGQVADPFMLEVHEGLVYHFESKTCGIIWRPAVASFTPIAGYCATHDCKTVTTQILRQQPQTSHVH